MGEKRVETKMEEKLTNSNFVLKAYQKPVLKRFGSVRTLTTSGTSGPNENSVHPRAMSASDPILKENILRIGTHSLNIGLYLFDYKPAYRNRWGHDRQFGVMADEVESVMPEAVSIHPDGYKIVNYAMLGIRRTTH